MNLSSRLLFSFLFLAPLIFLSSQVARAAACCGGGFAAPSIIAGDDKAVFTSSYSHTQVTIDNVDSRGVWRKSDSNQEVQTLRLEGAHLLSDRWQAGFSLPIIERELLNESHAGLGDVSATLAYEYLPDWNYNPIRPKGIGFLQLTLPTGKSRAESDIGGLDSRGNGFWAIGAGTLLTKSIGLYDAFGSIEIHRSFSKSFSNSQMSGELEPGYGGSFSLGVGYSLKNTRLGTSVAWTYEDAIDINGAQTSQGSPERYATASLSFSYLKNADWAGTLTYSDQTLFGDPINTSLGRSLALQIQRRWAR